MRRPLFVLLTVCTFLLVTVVPAGATPPGDVSIENHIADVNDPAPTPFTSSNEIICSAGEVETVGFKAAGNSPKGVNFQVIKLFTCDDGEFVIKLQVRLPFEPPFNTSFNWVVLGGTGAYERLRGSGSGIGVNCGFDCVTDMYEGGFHID